jgi:polygalacturonase
MPPSTSTVVGLAATAAVLSASLRTASAAVFDVRSYGGVGDGKTMNTVAFAKAMSAAASAPLPPSGLANQVLVTQGTYLTGQVELLSNVWLNITADATVLGSANVTDYPTDESKWALLFALGQNNIGVVGGGTIDGQQPLYSGGWNEQDNEFIPVGWLPGQCEGECRPRNIRFRTCTNILLQDVLNTHSPDWTTHLENCTNALVQRFRQYGDHRWPNNDGIDIDSSQNVTVIDSSFDTADDGVCIKSTVGLGVIDNIVVRNTTIRSRSAAIKFGSNTDTNCSNLLFENITIWDSNRGLGIQQRSQGNITNVTFRDITVETRYNPLNWWGSAEPIYISSMPRATGGVVGLISNVTFENIVARSENSAFLSGRSPGVTLQGITLRNVTITIDKWSNYSTPAHSYVPTTAVEPAMVFPPAMAVDGVYVEAAQGVVLEDVSVAYVSADKQPFWSRTCFNTTNAGYPVTTSGLSCTLW